MSHYRTFSQRPIIRTAKIRPFRWGHDGKSFKLLPVTLEPVRRWSRPGRKQPGSLWSACNFMGYFAVYRLVAPEESRSAA